MPFKSKRELREEIPLTDAERKQRIRQVQEEQEERLRRAIGNDFFEWLTEYDEGLNEWLRRLRQDTDVLSQD